MAAEVGFYHLEKSSLERALPRLLERVLASHLKAVVRTASDESAEALNLRLWTADPASFLPHGGPNDGHAELQPIYVTSGDEVPNGAEVLVLTESVAAGDLVRFQRCVDMFDGTDATALEAARGRWRALRAAGHSLTYWQQSQDGRWRQKDA